MHLVTEPYKSEGASIAFGAFGVKIGVSLEDRSLLNEILDRLPAGWEALRLDDLDQHFFIDHREMKDSSEWYSLSNRDGNQLGTNDRVNLPDMFESILEDFIARNAEPWIFLHAGVVGWQGRAIIIPGQSRAGKSTLVASLVAAGATYYSDEFAVLDAKGLVHPFPRRMLLRTKTDSGWNVRRIAVSHDLQPPSWCHPLPAALVALLTYDPDRDFSVMGLDSGAGIMAICGHTVPIRLRPADSLKAIQAMVNSARVVRGCRGEAEHAARWLLTTSQQV